MAQPQRPADPRQDTLQRNPAPPPWADPKGQAYARHAQLQRDQAPAEPIVPEDRRGSTQAEADLMNEALEAAGGTEEAKTRVLRAWDRGMSRETLFSALALEPAPAPPGVEAVLSNTTQDLTRTDAKYPQKGAVLLAGTDAKESEIQTGNPRGTIEPGMQGQATIEATRNHNAPITDGSVERNAPAPQGALTRTEDGRPVFGARSESAMKADAERKAADAGGEESTGESRSKRGPGRPSNAELAARKAGADQQPSKDPGQA